jgi:hypothetical protein
MERTYFLCLAFILIAGFLGICISIFALNKDLLFRLKALIANSNAMREDVAELRRSLATMIAKLEEASRK